MRSVKKLIIFVVLALIATPGLVDAQDVVFTHPDVDYSFSIPAETWRITARPSATSPNVEYVYGDTRKGHLEVRKMTVPKNSILIDVIQDEESKQQFRRGFVAGREENFVGKLRGTVYNFEYVDSGRVMAGRHYFLRANDTTVYVLRFEGLKDSLRSIRNQTDSIARTFSLRS